jgi:hypothetical protein
MTSYPPPPPPHYGPAPGGRQRLRGRIPLRLAAIFGIIGLGLAIAGIVVLVKSPINKVDDFVRAPVDGRAHAVELTRTGHYVVYFETPQSGSHRANVRLTVSGQDDDPLKLSVYGANRTSTSTLTYDLGGKHGEAAYTFSISRSGTYSMTATSSDAPAGSRMAFGESIAHGLVAGLALFFPGLFLVIAAVVLLIVGLVKRSRHKRELASAYRGGGNPWPGQAPGYGYPPPG